MMIDPIPPARQGDCASSTIIPARCEIKRKACGSLALPLCSTPPSDSIPSLPVPPQLSHYTPSNLPCLVPSSPNRDFSFDFFPPSRVPVLRLEQSNNAHHNPSQDGQPHPQSEVNLQTSRPVGSIVQSRVNTARLCGLVDGRYVLGVVHDGTRWDGVDFARGDSRGGDDGDTGRRPPPARRRLLVQIRGDPDRRRSGRGHQRRSGRGSDERDRGGRRDERGGSGQEGSGGGSGTDEPGRNGCNGGEGLDLQGHSGGVSRLGDDDGISVNPRQSGRITLSADVERVDEQGQQCKEENQGRPGGHDRSRHSRLVDVWCLLKGGWMGEIGSDCLGGGLVWSFWAEAGKA
ncbi:hypothetical protein HD553DRAFT_310991 [Filobasidium floriforme]|uniref:uncharacterized protein n=1 Tax=Filobasidium floriforme TaxID=5210 RepID=UPI001E8E4DA6|nr:uncharacterized protein HD553DRAFT_310991 [Filobasidium floriforme]KAH8085289.1 hypothetical protein HD553DRAFT_310991 [Filobasidium floriforme]